MKKILNKLILIVLVLALILSLFAGCDKKPTPQTLGAYILSDKATFLSYKNNKEGDKLPNLSILFEQDDKMINTYTMIAVDGDGKGFATPVTLNEVGADCFIKWMSLEETRALIAEYGKENYGESLFYLLEGSEIYKGTDYTFDSSGATNKVIRVSTTTSVNDSGLLGYLEPIFEKATGFDIQIASAGTGAAISAAKEGNADMLLVHSKSQEESFVKDGYSRIVSGFSKERVSFMYNFFVLIGPTSDPVGSKSMSGVTDAFKSIKEGGYSFVSRGDNSGTHTKEIDLWKGAGITDIGYDKTAKVSTFPAEYTWYLSTGQGMGASLLVANDTLIKK